MKNIYIMKIVIAGGSGFIGRALCKEFVDEKHKAVVLSRFRPGRGRAIPYAESRAWNPETARREWESALEGADAVLNLAGENIAEGRWTPQRKEQILKSRVVACRSLVEAMGRQARKPKVFISASAVGFYGPHGDGVIDESVGPGYGFLAQVCQKWEQEAKAAEKFGVRTVRLRLGMVLGKEGGALAKMLTPFKFGLGGPLGSGEQWVSWISIADVAGLISFILKGERLQGAVNATAPHPVINRAFATALGRALHRPAFFKVPTFILRLVLGEMSEMLLTGQRVLPKAAMDLGYQFRHPTLASAFKALL